MASSILSVPQISVSPPPPVQSSKEPFSPFTSCQIDFADTDDEACCRPTLLTPPPFFLKVKHLSPLCPPDVPVKGQGLERERFEMLLKASRERASALAPKNLKDLDLRKALAVKTHRSRQLERRVRFLQKLQQPPSPSAINMPKTPPESPAMLHYSMPSAGVLSPLAMYEYLEDELTSPWIEQVDFRLLKFEADSFSDKPSLALPSPTVAVQRLPSLDQISARLSAKQMSNASETLRRAPSPPRLKEERLARSQPRESSSIVVGRLQMPKLRPRSPPAEPDVEKLPEFSPSPNSELEIITTLVPRTVRPNQNLTEANVEALSRADMLNTLRRRSQPGYQAISKDEADERTRRRRSAPAELPRRERTEFKHPVLNLPGGF